MTDHEWSYEATMRELGDNPCMSVWAHIWLVMLQGLRVVVRGAA